jgi:hypothetical protein
MNSAAFQANRAAWVAAGYRGNMGSAIACRPPSDPNVRRVYHLTTAEHAISDIALGRLKLARFSDLNDPFELIAANFREREIRKVIRGFKSAFDAQTGLLSFSEDWVEPLLWSHYAARHRGICLGFNVPKNLLESVTYQDDRLRAELDKLGADPLQLPADLQQALRCTKYRRWDYECEYRRFVGLDSAVPEGRLHFVPFGPELELAEVILGTECVLSIDAVRDTVRGRYPNAVVFKARLEFKGFHIVPQESSVPV